jgi:membrane-associated protein
MHLDLAQLIKSVGYLGVWGIIFAESGFLIGFFLPGDTLLFTAGFLASQGFLDVKILILGCFICAVLGDNVGYSTGKRFGARLFNRKDSWLFNHNNLIKTKLFYEKHGNKAIVFARFVAIVRTFAPIIAGTVGMNYRNFLIYNLIGGFFWTVSLTLLGFFLGKSLPADTIDKYLLPVIGIVILISFIPSLIHFIKERRKLWKIKSRKDKKDKKDKNIKDEKSKFNNKIR